MGGAVVACCLLSIGWGCFAQSSSLAGEAADSPQAVRPVRLDADVTVNAADRAEPARDVAMVDTEDLPSAPEPNLQAAQSPSTGQSSSKGQSGAQQTEPSLGDLGFTQQQTQPNAQMQAMLEKRTHMLKVHQTLGLITAVPMFATLVTGPQAKVKGRNGQILTEPTDANLDLHIALGGLTTGLYYTTAYYAWFAPKIPGVKPKGAIRVHRDLEWIHGPGMIATPILGIMAYKQENAGEKVHGIASLHGPVAYVTAIAYGASIVSISWPIHWKFWESR